MSLVPVIDLAAGEKGAVATSVAEACERVGFLVVTGHGVPAAVIDRGWAAARAFFDLYQRVLQAKWKKFEIAAESPRQVTGTGDNGRFSLLLDGVSVHSIEGIQTPERVR